MRIILAAIAAVLCLAIFLAARPLWADGATIDENAEYRVESVLDGDTFKIRKGRKTLVVRMLGIDTPETVDPRKPEQCYGHEASVVTRQILEGHSVRLEQDPEREKKDRYGRLLAYAFVAGGSSVSVNEMLLLSGHAREYTYGSPYSRQAAFRAAEKQAKDNKYGLWGVCNP